VYLNRTTFRQFFSMKKLLFLKDFVAEPADGHQWEVGYRGYRLAGWEKKLTDCGWIISAREFHAHCRSVFHLLERAPCGADGSHRRREARARAGRVRSLPEGGGQGAPLSVAAATDARFERAAVAALSASSTRSHAGRFEPADDSAPRPHRIMLRGAC